jgi:type VII secretion protein EccE
MNPHQRWGRLAARVAGWQSAAACLLLPVQPSARAAAGGVVAGFLALFSIKYRSRRLPEWIRARMRFRRRMLRTRGYRPRTPIEAVVPGVDTRGHVDRAGNRVGLLADGPAWIAVLRLDPIPDGVLVDRLSALLDELARAVTGDSVDVDAVQLVGWSVPVSQPGADRGPVARPGAGRPPVLRTFWLAVRFLPGLHPAAVEARGGAEQGAVRSAAIAALRLATSLRQRGYRLRVLDGTELIDELGTSLGVQPPPRGSGGRPLTAQGRGPAAREMWRSWSLGALHHVCFRVRRVPRQRAGLAALFTLLARPPAVTTCVSVRYTRGGTGGCEVFVRLAVPADRNPRAVWSALRQATSGLRGHLTPMNGEQLPGVRATIPLATAP